MHRRRAERAVAGTSQPADRCGTRPSSAPGSAKRQSGWPAYSVLSRSPGAAHLLHPTERNFELAQVFGLEKRELVRALPSAYCQIGSTVRRHPRRGRVAHLDATERPCRRTGPKARRQRAVRRTLGSQGNVHGHSRSGSIQRNRVRDHRLPGVHRDHPGGEPRQGRPVRGQRRRRQIPVAAAGAAARRLRRRPRAERSACKQARTIERRTLESLRKSRQRLTTTR